MSQRQPAEPRQAKSAQTKSLSPAAHQLNLDAPTPTIASSNLSQATIQRALANPRALSPNDILQLQRTIGNQAVQRMLQRDTQASFEAGSDFESQLKRTQGSGSPLPKKTKHEFEQSLGADLGNVRIHTNAASDQLNRSIQAQAFTHGNDIHFGAGEFKPTTSQGKQLLAHELTHTIQQTGGKPANRVQVKLQVGAANDRYEQEAERVANSVSSDGAKRSQAIHPTGVQSVQRRLKFKTKDLVGKSSMKSRFRGAMGMDSDFRILHDLLKGYWKLPSNLDAQEQSLNQMSVMADQWLAAHLSDQNKGQNKRDRYTSVARLRSEIQIELNKLPEKKKSRDFLQKFGKGSDVAKSGALKNSNLLDKFTGGKQLYHDQKYNIKHPVGDDIMYVTTGTGDRIKENVPENSRDDYRKKYEKIKPFKLTPAERVAIHAYTDVNYRYINPAMAGDEGWMQGNMEWFKAPDEFTKSKTGLQKAMALNKEMGDMALSGLNKLPNWEQDKTIYRGDNVTTDEAQKMKKGYIKEYKYFVSTSQSLTTARDMLGSAVNTDRPWAIVFHIVDSESGKDIAVFSHLETETEILFPPGTKFMVTEVLSVDNAKKRKEVKVVQV